MLLLKNQLPQKQGLRQFLFVLFPIRLVPQKPTSTKTRIKTINSFSFNVISKYSKTNFHKNKD